MTVYLPLVLAQADIQIGPALIGSIVKVVIP